MTTRLRIRLSGVVWFCTAVVLSGCADTTSPTSPSTASATGGSSLSVPLDAGVDPVLVTRQGGRAGQKVSLCHMTGTDAYVQINVNVASEPAHRAHGDGAVGDEVPGQEGMEFDADCIPVQTPDAGGPIRWTLNQVAFTDGGTATGYFDFDAATATVLSWDISVAGGNTTAFPAFNYHSSLVGHVAGINSAHGQPDGQGFVFLNPSTNLPRRILRVDPDGLLTNTGGVLPLSTAVNANIECFNCNPFRVVEFSNQPFVSGVPAP